MGIPVLGSVTIPIWTAQNILDVALEKFRSARRIPGHNRRPFPTLVNPVQSQQHVTTHHSHGDHDSPSQHS